MYKIVMVLKSHDTCGSCLKFSRMVKFLKFDNNNYENNTNINNNYN